MRSKNIFKDDLEDNLIFDTMKDFQDRVESLAERDQISLLEAIGEIVESYDIEYETVNSFISDPLRIKILDEAEDSNLLKDESSQNGKAFRGKRRKRNKIPE